MVKWKIFLLERWMILIFVILFFDWFKILIWIVSLKLNDFFVLFVDVVLGVGLKYSFLLFEVSVFWIKFLYFVVDLIVS